MNLCVRLNGNMSSGHHRTVSFTLIFLSALFLYLAALLPANGQALRAEWNQTSSGKKYLIIRSDSCKLSFELLRPDSKDPELLLCIPAAFTAVGGGLCGLYAREGEIYNQNLIDLKMSGGIEIKNGSCRIFDTAGGTKLNAEFIEKLKSDKASFFQQFQIVKDGKAEHFKDYSEVQRRCIALKKDACLQIVESCGPVSLSSFAVDLVEMGVENAIYTDMGPWGHGWYRDSTGKLVGIGQSRSMTHKQSNWVVFRK